MIYLLIPSLIWAFSYGLIKTSLANLNPSFVATFRILCACTLFVPFLKPRSLSRAQIAYLMVIGAIQYGLMYISLMYAFRYLKAYQVALFTTFTPFYVILFNDWFDRKFNLDYMKVAAIAVLGGAIIYWQNLQQENLLQGALLVQLADICFAFGQIAYKRFKMQLAHLRNVDIYALLFFGGLLITTLAMLITGGWDSMRIVSSGQWLVMLYLGLCASGICFFLWNKGAVMINAATLAVFNNLKSPLAILVALCFFGESTNLLYLGLGLSLILVALYQAEYRGKRLEAQA